MVPFAIYEEFKIYKFLKRPMTFKDLGKGRKDF